jgi:hypothetical protein
MMAEQPTITDVDSALTFATDTNAWREWSEYVDKLLDQRLEAAGQS